MIWRIRGRTVFAELQSRGQRVSNGAVRITFVAVPTGHPQVALALSRRFGNAVERNRGRRRLRAAFRAAWDAQADGRTADEVPGVSGAFLLSGSRRLLSDPFDSIVRSVVRCLDEIRSRARPEVSGAIGSLAAEDRRR